MPTLLTQRKMEPALAARIEATLHRRSEARGDGIFSATAVAVLRVAIVLALVAAACALFLVRRRDSARLEAARRALLDAVHAQAASLTEEDARALPRVHGWLRGLSGSYEGDFVADELRAPGALDAALSGPTMYVHADLGDLVDAVRTATPAETSGKDALLFCLAIPPASRDEAALLAHLRDASTLAEARTANVHLLRDAEAGLPLLLPPWSARVTAARGLKELARLKEDLDRAPLVEAKRAAAATLLLLAIDEPGEGGGFVQLEGDRAHAVRVAIVDLRASRVLLRLRRRVDPTWIAPQRRARHSVDLDGCLLALDVRAATTPAAPGE